MKNISQLKGKPYHALAKVDECVGGWYVEIE